MSRARRFVANRAAVAGALVIVLLVAVAVLARWIGKDPLAHDIEHGLSRLGAPLAPSGDALLGTDQLGRDVWARLAAGASTSLLIAGLATAFALAIGLSIGLVAGYAGGWVDTGLMRTVDLVLSFPVLLLAILLAALLREAGLGSSIAPVVLTLAIVSWTTMARVIRGKAMTLARSEHVIAARALGASPARIIVRHILPNILGALVVVVALGFAQNLLAEAALSYLGLGPPPPAPTWGRMLYEGRVFYRTSPHLVIAPGLAILIAVVSFNLVADGVRDAFDPKVRR
ncbi:MAG: ABC transporter permease [Deltaproteobacteria bacterium]|nr:ABC transporter permease [Deltaproteobacteria bacterium]